MVVGTAISQLIEQPGKGMKFNLDEMESSEATWYLGLIQTEDNVGSMYSIKADKATMNEFRQGPPKRSTSAISSRPQAKPYQGATRIVAIEEIDDSNEEDEDEEDDLIPYEKPDEDPVDEDDDPTLIQRNKPSAPV
jgi:telomere length regulation protein